MGTVQLMRIRIFTYNFRLMGTINRFNSMTIDHSSKTIMSFNTLNYTKEFEQLFTKGWAVFPNVVPQELCKVTRSEFSDYYQDMTGGKLTEWEFARQDYDKFFPRHGILSHPQSLSHADFVTTVRDHENVRKIYLEIYERIFPHLRVNHRSKGQTFYGYDRVNYQPSPAMLGRKTPNYKGERFFWWHVDQRAGSDIDCFQGYVDICGTPSEKSAGLQVVDESHLDFEHLSFYYKDVYPEWRNDDWGRFTRAELNAALPGWQSRVINVTSNPGDLVVWNSKMLHMSRRNTAGIFNSEYFSERFVIYACHWPLCQPWSGKAEKRKLFEANKWTSSHWPDCRKRMKVGDPHGKPIDIYMDVKTQQKWITPSHLIQAGFSMDFPPPLE